MVGMAQLDGVTYRAEHMPYSLKKAAFSCGGCPDPLAWVGEFDRLLRDTAVPGRRYTSHTKACFRHPPQTTCEFPSYQQSPFALREFHQNWVREVDAAFVYRRWHTRDMADVVNPRGDRILFRQLPLKSASPSAPPLHTVWVLDGDVRPHTLRFVAATGQLYADFIRRTVDIDVFDAASHVFLDLGDTGRRGLLRLHTSCIHEDLGVLCELWTLSAFIRAYLDGIWLSEIVEERPLLEVAHVEWCDECERIDIRCACERGGDGEGEWEWEEAHLNQSLKLPTSIASRNRVHAQLHYKILADMKGALRIAFRAWRCARGQALRRADGHAKRQPVDSIAGHNLAVRAISRRPLSAMFHLIYANMVDGLYARATARCLGPAAVKAAESLREQGNTAPLTAKQFRYLQRLSGREPAVSAAPQGAVSFSGTDIIPSGKHAGKTFKYVTRTDRKFCGYILGLAEPRGWVASFQAYCKARVCTGLADPGGTP